MENISVNKLEIFNERQNILERLLYKNVQLDNSSNRLFDASSAPDKAEVYEKIDEINAILSQAKIMGGIDFKKLDDLSNGYEKYIRDIDSVYMLIKEIDQITSEILNIQIAKTDDLIIKLSNFLQKRNVFTLSNKMAIVNNEFVKLKYKAFGEGNKIIEKGYYKNIFSNVIEKNEMESFVDIELSVFVELIDMIDNIEETLFNLNKRENNKKSLKDSLLSTDIKNQDHIVSHLLEDMNSTVANHNEINKGLFFDARVLTWTLASILIILSVIIGVILRKRMVLAVDNLLEMTQLNLSGDFKELQLLSSKYMKNSELKVEVFSQIHLALNSSAKKQQQMIFDIDTACQGLTMGYLDQNTSYPYQGEYTLIEHSLNVARTSINKLVKEIVRSCDALAMGDLTTLNNPSIFCADYKAIPESITKISLNLQRQLFDMLTVTANMEFGLEDQKKFSLPDDCYHGDFVQIQTRLESTVHFLKQFAQHNNDQNWLKSGLSEMNRQLTGEQPLETLTKNSVDFLSHYFDAPIGYLYRSIEDKNIGKAIRLISHYGVLMDEETRLTQYKFVYPEGVGLIGQVFVSPEIIVKKLAEDERQPISQSGIANAMLNYIVVLPLMHEGKVEGVLELGLYREPSKIQKEFLHQVKSNLGIAINVAVSRDKMKLLLAQSQRQAEELELHQSQLGKSNDELQHKAQQLQEKQQAVELKNEQLEQASIKMEEKTNELMQASRYKSEFLANMSHELRSPLNSLLILSKLLIDNKKGNLNDSEVKYAEVIYRSGSDLLILIEDILDHSKIEAGKTDINFTHENLEAILILLKENFSEIAVEKKLDFRLSYTAAPKIVEVDKKRLVQVITNLLANAFKFTMEGSVSLNVSVHQEGDVYNIEGDEHHKLEFDALCFCVKDTGIGIAQENKERVFRAFAQADGTTSRKFGGTGLGLSISLHLVELMGGFLYLETELHKGSLFYIYIPLRTLNDQVLSENAPIAILDTSKNRQAIARDVVKEKTAIEFVKPKILYVCTLASNSRFMGKIVETKGLKIQTNSAGFSPAVITSTLSEYVGVLVDKQAIGLTAQSEFEQFESKLVECDIPLLVIDESRLSELSSMSESISHKSEMKKLSKFLRSVEANQTLSQQDIMQSYFDQGQMLEGKKVLIVDDNISNVFALTAILENYNMKYAVADDGLQAIEIIKDNQDFDIILMDIMMPELDGYQTMKAIRECPAYLNTPIIALTAKAMPEDRNKCILAGANDYMTKPLDADRLIVLLKMWLATTPNVATLCEINE